MGLFGRFRKTPEQNRAEALYLAAVTRAREPAFYERLAVPDTVEGRFDMIALHVFLILRRLKADRAETGTLAQALFDRMFLDMDENLREMGVGDLGVGKRVKKMAKAFYGRVAAYDAALAQDSRASLEAALHRNLYREADDLDPALLSRMAAYVQGQAAALDAKTLETMLGDGQTFAPAAIPAEQEDLP